MSRAYLSIGSNMGDRRAYLSFAVSCLRRAEGVSSVVQSALYSTAPWGGVEQDDFLNAALRLELSLSPANLLQLCQKIEQAGGRQRLQHWGARTLDIDILLFDDLELADAELKLPHPYLTQRRFVLQPLLDVADEQLHPLCANWLAACPDVGSVVQIAAADEW